VQKGGSCVSPPPPTVCTPPARLNSQGACQCPANTVAVGKSCVLRAQPRQQPGVAPGDIMRVLPGLVPRGGGEPGGGGPIGPRGGGQGGPAGGPGKL
jgi:hypothetical protein